MVALCRLLHRRIHKRLSYLANSEPEMSKSDFPIVAVIMGMMLAFMVMQTNPNFLNNLFEITSNTTTTTLGNSCPSGQFNYTVNGTMCTTISSSTTITEMTASGPPPTPVNPIPWALILEVAIAILVAIIIIVIVDMFHHRQQYCKHCGEPLEHDAESCSKCGVFTS